MNYYVYIATNKRNTVLYIGVTNDVNRRMNEHKMGLIDSFTKRYNVNKLVYFYLFNNPEEAINIEKKLKGWKRERKIELIKKYNPDFRDLIDL